MTLHYWFKHEADRILRSDDPAIFKARRFVAHLRRWPDDNEAIGAVHDLLVELDERRRRDSVAA